MSKKTLLIQLALFISSTFFGQQMQNLTFGKSYKTRIPVDTNDSDNKKRDYLSSYSIILNDSLNQFKQQLSAKGKTPARKGELDTINKRLVSIEAKIAEAERKQKELSAPTDISDIITKLNASEKFIISTSGGLTNLTDKAGSGGSLVISTKVRLTDYKPCTQAKNWVDPHFLYVGFNARSNVSEDSSNILKNIIFPEISKRDFVIGYEHLWLNVKRSKTISIVGEAGLNRVVVDTIKGNSVQLRYESLMFGIKYTKIGQIIVGKDTAKVGISFSPNVSVVNIQPKYKPEYDFLITQKQYRPTWWMIGFQAIVQLTDLQVFCSGRYIMNRDSKSLPPDLRGFVYTLGTVVNLDVFKL